MAAEVGHGAAGYTAVKTKAGTSNPLFDARNFFNRRSFAQPARIPPFQRFNEFGTTTEARWWFQESLTDETEPSISRNFPFKTPHAIRLERESGGENLIATSRFSWES